MPIQFPNNGGAEKWCPHDDSSETGLCHCRCGGVAKFKFDKFLTYVECSKCKTRTIETGDKEKARKLWNGY